MKNQIRNELLIILSLSKKQDELSKSIEMDNLLEQFEYDIKNQLEELKRKEKELNENLELLEYVRKNK